MSTGHALNEIWRSERFRLAELPVIARALVEQLSDVLNAMEGQVIPTGVVALQGQMGAGKTTLVKAVCAAWNVEEDAVSPTFGLIQCYNRQGKPIYHLDLYRLRHEEEAWDLGLTEYFDGEALNFVEWPEQAPGLLPEDAVLLEVRVHGPQHDGERELILSRAAS